MAWQNILLDVISLKHKRGHWFHTMACTLADKWQMPVNDYIRYLVLKEYEKEFGDEDFSNKRIQR